MEKKKKQKQLKTHTHTHQHPLSSSPQTLTYSMFAEVDCTTCKIFRRMHMPIEPNSVQATLLEEVFSRWKK